MINNQIIPDNNVAVHVAQIRLFPANFAKLEEGWASNPHAFVNLVMSTMISELVNML